MLRSGEISAVTLSKVTEFFEIPPRAALARDDSPRRPT